MSAAVSTSSGLSLGLSIAVCTRFGDELFAWSAIAREVLDQAAYHARGQRVRHAHERRGKQSDDLVHRYVLVTFALTKRGSRTRALRQIRDGRANHGRKEIRHESCYTRLLASSPRRTIDGSLQQLHGHTCAH